MILSFDGLEAGSSVPELSLHKQGKQGEQFVHEDNVPRLPGTEQVQFICQITQQENLAKHYVPCFSL